jgi:hypothetical protein
MATLHTYRTALDEMATLFSEGSLSKASYLVTKRAINNQVYQVLRDAATAWPSERYHEEVRTYGFSAVSKKVEEHFGMSEARAARNRRLDWRMGDPV